MREQKKSQIQIGETVAVLFVFFILIVVALMFYVKVIKGNLELEKEELSQIRSIGTAQRVMFLPELQCSEDVVTEISNCIDILKLESAKDIINNNEVYYYDLFEFSKINITQIYPEDTTFCPTILPCNIYSREIDNFKNKFVTNVPVSLYNPITRKHSFGILTIETLN